MRLNGLLFKEHYRLVVVGGGAGGCSTAARFSRRLDLRDVAIVEPNEKHYYQPGFTLAAAGLYKFDRLVRNQLSLIPPRVDWYKNFVLKFRPQKNYLILSDGKKISYDFLVISGGLELRFDLIKGLSHEVILSSPGLCSIYTFEGAKKTLNELNHFSGVGNAIFTFPNTPIKCGGAPQKICYLAEEIFRKTNKRANSKVLYCTSLPDVFGVQKYAQSLRKIIDERAIEIHTRLSLSAIDPTSKKATFDILGTSDGKPSGRTQQFEYSLLHVGPPCSPIRALREHSQSGDDKNGLTDENGWVRVDPKKLQNPVYPNVFAIGDCANTPNAKSAAATASQIGTLDRNLSSAMQNRGLYSKYDGYSSCPLVVDRRHVILAEFNPSGPLETFGTIIDQSKPSWLAYLMKRYAMPFLYWRMMLNGRWTGPSSIRKALNFLTMRK